MAKVSVIIPARNEIFLLQTINSLQANAAGEIEIIAVLDGYWPNPPLPNYDNLKIIHFGGPRGMRAGINAAAGIAKGKYLFKCDAHCMFEEGFDEILKADYEDNWVVIPRRYSLDAANWKIDEIGKPPRDYHYLCYPHWDKPHDAGMHGVEWPERGRQWNEGDRGRGRLGGQGERAKREQGELRFKGIYACNRRMETEKPIS